MGSVGFSTELLLLLDFRIADADSSLPEWKKAEADEVGATWSNATVANQAAIEREQRNCFLRN